MLIAVVLVINFKMYVEY